MIDYYLPSAASGPVILEIRDAAGKLVRRYSSTDPVPPADPALAIPTYWVRPPLALSSSAGMHRFLWDMHYSQVPGIKPAYPIAAVPYNTAPQATSPWVMPGQYTALLKVGAKSYSQPFTVQMDPRVRTPVGGLAQQSRLSQQLYRHLLTVSPAFDRIVSLRDKVKELQAQAKDDTLTALNTFDQKLQALAGTAARRPGAAPEAPSLGVLRTRLLTLMTVLQDADEAPTTQATGAVAELEQQLPPVMQRWQAIQTQDLPALNAQLRKAGLPELKLESNPPEQEGEGNEE